MLNSSRSSTSLNSKPPRRSTQGPGSAFAVFTVAVVATTAIVKPATATPIPFLDFLYPSFYSSQSPPSSSLSPPANPTNPRKASRSKARPVSAAPVPAAGLNAQRGQLQRQKQRRRLASTQLYPPQLAKRGSATGQKVPVKYESVASGWVIDNSWNLHGHRFRSDPPPPNNSDATPILPVQNLDTTGGDSSVVDPNGGNITMDENGLDLPVGWQHSPGVRHESYDPVIVAVFAVILVASILGTIGLCRWRARKLRRLRDLEKMERESERTDEEEDTGSSSGSREKFSEKEKASKRKKLSGSSSAIRKRFARFRRRYRAKTGTAENGDPVVEGEKTRDAPGDPQATSHDRLEDATQQQDHEAVSSTTSTIMDDTSSVTDAPLTEEPPGATEPPIITTPGQQRLSLSSPPPPPPTSSPPAYPQPPAGNTSARVTIAENSLPPEKMPIRGLEAEYDDRDIAVYISTAASAYTLRPRRSRVRFVDQVAPESALAPDQRPREDARDEERVPSFEPFASPAGNGAVVGASGGPSLSLSPTRVAAGATLRAHVATDDKGLLERLRSLADDPVVGAIGVGLGPSAPVIRDSPTEEADTDVDPVTLSARAPPWSEVDEWDAERQMELVGASNVNTAASGIDASNSNSTPANPSTAIVSNVFPPLLPPPPATSTYGSTGLVNYGLGTVWSGLNRLSSSSAEAGVPSAPPFQPSNLLPSAPPPPADGDVAIPSAPPAWDDEDAQEVQEVEEEPSVSATTQNHSQTAEQSMDGDAQKPQDAHLVSSTPAESSSTTAPVPVPVNSTDREGDSDGEGAESIVSTPPDNEDSRSGWSATFRTRREEGAGLPRYEP